MQKLIKGYETEINEVLNSTEGILVLVYDGEIGCPSFRISYVKFIESVHGPMLRDIVSLRKLKDILLSVKKI